MKQVLVFSALVSLALGAPQYLAENKKLSGKLKDEGCHTEYVTVWEDIETEEVNKVICETEFKEECFTEYEEVCVNATEKVCSMVDEMVCVDSVTNKCGLEQVLKNETYTETECKNVLKNICEYEWIGEGKSRKWVPVEGSCVTKPLEECEDVEKVKENFVEEEVCRDIPIKDCRNMPKEVCVDPVDNQVCNEVPQENCEIVPHEECKQVTDKIPKKVSKRVMKIICDGQEEPKESDDEINLKTSIDEANDSENEIDDQPEIKKPDIHEEVTNEPENITEEPIVHEEDVDVAEEELGVNVDDANEPSDETTHRPEDDSTIKTINSEDMSSEEMPTEKSSDKEITTEVIESETTDADTPDRNTPMENANAGPSKVPNRKFDDSRIIFSDEAIDNRNKVLATRVFIDDGLLSPKVEESSTPRESSPNDRIFFPDQDLKG